MQWNYAEYVFLMLGMAFIAVALAFYGGSRLRLRAFGILPVAYGQVVAGMDDGVIVLDGTCRVVSLNPAAQCIIGNKSWQAADSFLAQFFGATPEVDRLCHGLSPAKVEVPRQMEGRDSWYEVSVSPLRDRRDNTIGRILVLRDITERKATEKSLRDSESMYRELTAALPQPVFETDIEMRLTFVNESALACFGYTREEFEAGVNVMQAIVPADRLRAREDIDKAMRGEGPTGHEYEALRKDGTTFPVTIYSSRIIRNGRVAGLRGIIIDVTERKQAEKKLIYASSHDPLTGLYNRRYFEHALSNLEGGSSYPVTVVSMDLDDLKLLNDSLGHQAGDDLLKAHASVLRLSFRKSDVIARVGGDEFAVILQQTDAEEAGVICSRLQSQIDLHNRCRPDLQLSISLGTETASGPDLPLEEAFRASDLRMYADKLSRKPARQQSLADIH